MIRTLAIAVALLLGAPALAKPVTLTTADGVALSAQVDGSGAKGVVLVHARGRTGQDWEPLARRLASEGYRVLTLDLRGHGGSKLATPVPDDGWLVATADVKAATAWLTAQGVTEIHLVGDGLGANLCLVEAAEDPAVKDVVLVDAGLNLDGVKLPTPLAAYGSRALLFIVSSADAYAVKSADLLQPRAQGPNDVYQVAGSAQLAAMLQSNPELTSVVLSWVSGTFFLSEGDLDKARSGLSTGDTTGMETKGKSFGEK